MLVPATGRHRLTAAASGQPPESRAGVFAVLPPGGGPRPAVERPVRSPMERLAGGVRAYLDGPAQVGGDPANAAAG